MTRIKIAVGALAIEYEGEQSFVEDGLIALVEQVFQLSPSSLSEASAHRTAATNSVSTLSSELSTNTIAQMIGVKTGSELALAAVARVILINKKPTADRQDILEEMKEAVTFYKESYSSNLTAYLETLVKSRRLNVVSRGTYGLASGERGRLEQALAMADA